MQIKKHIPNLLTLGNLVCGVLAILALLITSRQPMDIPENFYKLVRFKTIFDFSLPFYFICAGLVLDLFDGLVARLLGADSHLGVQLDSLADMVTFGVAPAIFILTHYNTLIDGYSSNSLALFAFTIYLCCGALRLAKYNVSGSSETRFFSGLPIPAAAIAIIGIPFVYHSSYLSNIDLPFIIDLFGNKLIFLVWSLGIGLLMVSPVPLFSFKFKNFTWADNWFRYVLVVIAIALLLWLKLAALPIIILVYIVMSLVFRKQFVN